MKNHVIALVVLLFLLSCKKKETCEGNFETLPKSELDYWFFPEGTQWIYKAKGYDLFDTVTVVRNEVIQTDKADDGGPNGEVFVCGTDYTSIHTSSYYTCFGIVPQFVYTNGTHFGSLNTVELVYPETGCPNEIADGWHSSLGDEIDPITIGDTVYTNVRGRISESLDAHRYHVQGIGVVELKMHNDSITWQLQEYFINNEPKILSH